MIETKAPKEIVVKFKTNLPKLKDQAHFYFDQIWELNYLTRAEAYQWLSEQLGVPEPEAHMRNMSAENCKKVIESSIMILNDMRRLDMDFGVKPQHPYYQLINI
jgi:hypothetical protein